MTAVSHHLRFDIIYPPLTDPAKRPRMKQRCIDKKTMTGTIIEMTADAFSRCSWSLNVPTVSVDGSGIPNLSALFGPI